MPEGRPRNYDPGTGQFTQQDPIGLAGGLNLYGFASGDPVNQSDPFGLSSCPEGKSDPDCEESVREKAVRAAQEYFDRAASRVISVLAQAGNYLRREGAGILAQEAALAAIPVVGELNAGRRVLAVSRVAGRFLSESNHLRDASIGARHAWQATGLSADDVVGQIVATSSWEGLAGSVAGRLTLGERVLQYSIVQNRSRAAEWVLNAWIVP